MENQQLIEKIFEANTAYRNGNEIMSDREYDELLDSLKEKSPKQYKTIRHILMDGSTIGEDSVALPIIVGSLEKLKNGDNETISEWNKINKSFTGDEYIITSKVDGLSLLLCYNNGKLNLITTRGDGKNGENKTEKLKSIVPKKLTGKLSKGVVIIRGEGVMTDEAFKEVNSSGVSYKAKRNAAVGLVNAKSSTKINNLCKKFLTFISYQIYQSDYKFESYYEILEELQKQGFKTPIISKISTSDFNSENLLKIYTEHNSKELYDIDGIVIQSNFAFNETTKYIPEHSIAFKANLLNSVSTIIDFNWEVSKDGSLRPIAIIEPIVMNNATITKASAFNTEWIINQECGVGAQVEIQMQGDIIPGITGVITKSTNYNFPKVCPSCGKLVKRKGKFIYCINPGCKARAVKSLAHFLKNLEIGFAGETNLENWNIFSVNDLIEFQPFGKQQEKFCKELKDKLWNISESKLVKSFDYAGIGKKIIEKILSVNSLEDFINRFFKEDYSVKLNKTTGITDSTFKRISEGIKFNDIVNSYFSIIYNDNWHKHFKDLSFSHDKTLSGKSFCFTGALTIPRKMAESLVKEHGGEIKSSVNKTLTYLVTNDPNSGTSKNKKAFELGVNVINEKTFFSIVNYELPENLKTIANIQSQLKKAEVKNSSSFNIDDL